MTLQHLRSSTANKRPDPTAMADGQIALNTAAASPGLFYKDSAGNLVKAGPVHVGSTAPNVSPASGGTAGNSTGESWLDTSGSNPLLKIWSGAAWQTVQPVASGTVVSTADTGSVTSTMIADGTIVNADVNASAAIAGTKISPDFGSQNVTTTGTVTGASLNPTSSTVPTNGVYLPAANSVAISTNSTGRLFIDSSGNVGIGQAPSAWNSAYKSVEGLYGGIAFRTNATETEIANNAYRNSAGTWIYKGNGFAQRILQDSSGDTVYLSAASGTAGNTATFSEQLRLTQAGRLGIGTSSPGYPLHVAGRISYTGAIGEGSDITLSSSSTTLIVGDSATWQNLALKTNGNNRLYINSSGNVGIGTASPGSTLDVQAATGIVKVSSTTGTNTSYFQASNTGSNFYIGKDNSTGTNFGSAYAAVLWNEGNNPLVFATNSTQRAQIDASGRLLVGTSSAPTGSSSQFTKLAVQGNSANNQAAFVSFGYGQAATSLAGDVNIATINFTDTAAGQFASIQCATDGSTGANDYPGRLTFSTTADGASSTTERMRITNSGYLKASNTGTYDSATSSNHEFNQSTDTQISLHRNTSTSLTQTINGLRVQYSGASPNSTVANFLYCDDSSALRASIRSNGGLANFQANNVNLSDRNTKKDISPAAATWDCIKEWEIVNYRYKDQPDDADLNLGVIAQQVAESCPEVITVFEQAKDDQPEKLGVKEQQMYWMAIKALQEAQVRIETLEAKVAALESA